MLRKSGKKKNRRSNLSQTSSSRKSRFTGDSDSISQKSVDPFDQSIRNSFEMPERDDRKAKSERPILESEVSDLNPDLPQSEKIMQNRNFKKGKQSALKQEVIEQIEIPKSEIIHSNENKNIEKENKETFDKQNKVEIPNSETASQADPSESQSEQKKETQSELFKPQTIKNDFEPKSQSVQINSSNESKSLMGQIDMTSASESLISDKNRLPTQNPEVKRSKIMALNMQSMGSLPLRKTETNLYINRRRDRKKQKSGQRRKSKSEIRTQPKKQKIRNTIIKDVDRTFQGERYFKMEETKLILETVLYNYSLRSTYHYVQGMNFIAASIIHHSLNYELVFNIFLFIQGNFIFHSKSIFLF